MQSLEAPDRKDLLKRALVRMDQLERELQAARDRVSEPIAIIGMGCRFPGGANDPERFRELLLKGFDATGDIPDDRWDVEAYYDPDPDTPGTMYVRRGAFLDRPVGEFDAAFFGIAPREADEMDPQQRLLTEVVWETLEEAGQSPDSLRGSPTGVFVGMAAHDWSRMQAGGGDTTGIGTYYGTGSAHSVAAGRISYLLGLRGPALTIDTACSSSLIAFHEACQSLRSGETKMALAAGVSLVLAPDGHVIASRGRMLSPRGYCSTFDASADGYVRGEGCAVVLLKRLSDAQADGDRILALVRGTASNQDGRSGGLTVPSGTAQEEVMRTALTASGMQPADVDYVEAHGTGTELGDPIEIHALAGVHVNRPVDRPLLVGSVKTNVGHLEGAAGLAGVVKSVIALREGVIPPHIHLTTPNPHINWDAAPIRVPTEATPWPRPERRVAGVSSFGFSGTNVHVVLEGAPEGSAATEDSATGAVLVPLSARTPTALAALAGQLADRLEARPQLTLAAVARTLSRGRTHWEERAAIVAATREELIDQLRQLSSGEDPGDSPSLRVGTANRKRTPRVAFLFTGQGSQRPGMGRELLASESVFRAAVERCDELLAGRLGVSVADLLNADPDDATAAETLRQTHITQPALFVLEYALAELWRSRGVRPTVVAGHSIGEFAAACVAGIISLEDALTLVVERGRLMGSLPEGGAMATIFASEKEVRARLRQFAGRASLAAVNAPGSTVISGDEDAVEALLAEMASDGVQARRLTVSHAFHSHRMDPAVPQFRTIATAIPHAPPTIDIVAAATGERAGVSTFGADYWARQLRDPVLFRQTVEAVRAEGAGVLLEIGPAPVLLSLAASCPGGEDDEVRQPSLRPGTDATRVIAEALGALYVAGVPIDWRGVHPGPLHPVSLPTYPFERQHHWFAPRRKAAVAGKGHPLLGRRVESPHFAGTIFENVLHEDQPEWVAEHRVFGRPVLPAAAYVEMCRAAVIEVAGEALRPARLRILEALTIEGDTPVQVIVDRDAGVVRVASRNAAGSWRIHVEGALEAVDASRAGQVEIPGGEGEPIDVEAMLAKIEENGVAYGPAFRALKEVRRNGNVAVGTLAATQIPARERRRYGLHPALLDAAFQLCGATVDASDAVYLPVEVAAIAVERDESALGGDTLRARATLREGDADAAVLVCDVEVIGGGERLLIEGLRFQRARQNAPSLEQRVAEWLYQPVWERVEVSSEPLVGNYLVVGEGVLANATVSELRARGAEAEVVAPSAVASMLESRPKSARLSGVLLFAEQGRLPGSGGELGAALRPVLEPVLKVARLIASGVACDSFTLVTRDGTALQADDQVDPAHAAAWALGHTIAAELQNLTCLRVDLPATLQADRAAAAVTAVLSAENVEERLAWRGGEWHAQRLGRIEPAPSIPPVVVGMEEEERALWITGGLGGVGLALARQLAEQGHRRFVLTGRSHPSQEANALIEEMRAGGAEVEVKLGDVTRLEEVERIRDAILERGWQISQLYHGAAVLDDALLPRQDWDRFNRVLGPKAAGAWNLHLATRSLPLKSFVLFSAGAGLLGSPGQANYAAANGFLDGLTHQRRSQGLPATSILWGPWADVGMAARAGLDWSATGLRGIDASGGAMALRQTIERDLATPVVLQVDWDRFPARDADGSPLPFFSRVVRQGADGVGTAGSSGWLSLLEELPVVERRQKLESLLSNEVVAVMGLSASRTLSPQTGLMDLGMDSLMAVEIGNRVGKACGLSLPSTFGFERPTLRAMSDYLLEALDLLPDPATEKRASTISDEDLATMSEEEASSALLDELEQIGY